MARPVRIEFPGACCHVMARGNERHRIFHADSDYKLFVKTLAEAVEQFSLKVHAYGYKNGSGVLEMVKRLEKRAEKNKTIPKGMTLLRRNVEN